MNVSLERQRKELASSLLLTSDDIHHSEGPGLLSRLSSFCITQKDTMHTDMHRPTHSFYILEELGVLVFQQWQRVVLRCVMRETSKDGNPALSSFFSLNTRNQLLKT